MRQSTPARRLLGHLILLGALALRGIIPVGFMPATIDGTLALAFCNEHGASTELVEAPAVDGGPWTGEQCDFGFSVSMAGLAALPHRPSMDTPSGPQLADASALPPVTLAARAASARGPPLS